MGFPRKLIFSKYLPSDTIEKALNLFLVLHADHEQNCSTSTVRVVGSSRANLFSSVAAGVCALWGPLHGGANAAVIAMLEDIKASGKPLQHYLDMAKDRNNQYRLMGFGHRVYKNFDPRSIDINTENGLIITSPPLAGEMAAFIDDLTSTDNAWRVTLEGDDGFGPLRWTSRDEVLTRQPSPKFSMRIYDFFYGLLPIESQL